MGMGFQPSSSTDQTLDLVLSTGDRLDGVRRGPEYRDGYGASDPWVITDADGQRRAINPDYIVMVTYHPADGGAS